MGALTPALQFLPVVAQGATMISNMKAGDASRQQAVQSQRQALADLKRKQNEHVRQMSEDSQAERARISTATAESKRERRNALRRAVARQKTLFGGRGIGSSGGSAEAVLLGLFEESDADRVERERIDNLRFSALDRNLDQQRRLNVIQRTQLQEKQKIQNLSSSGDNDFSDYLNLGTSLIDTF